ncbi:MAG: protein kinase [Phycisphaerae bacterium]|nr:protein kinase [Phycisphaerae bacterium]
MNGPKAGDRISEYILDRMVGAGSFGQVWKARHHIWKDNVVAVKVPTDSQYVRNLQKEGTVIHGLRHANIVRAIGLDPYAETPYLIMEFVEGCSLRELINAHPRGMPIRAAQNVVCALLAALDHAHSAGVVHRDIKPANILIVGGDAKDAEQLTTADVKVTDFGLGHIGEITTQSIMQSGSMLAEDGRSISGTLAYMSPEQRDGQAIDGRSDLYAVGIVLFEMITGERPSGSDMPSELRAGLPTWVDRIYSRMYTRRERRFETASQALSEILSSSVPPIARGHLSPVSPGATPSNELPGSATVYHPSGSAAPPVLTGRGIGTVSCPACGTKLDAGDNFCIMCGTQVVAQPRRCSHCASYPGPDDKYCVFCGTPLPDDAGI